MIRSALFLFTCAAAFAASGYTVQMIPLPSGMAILYLSGINNAGQAAGMGSIGASPGFITQAIIGSPSGSYPIPFPAGWSTSFGNAINSVGQVTGYVGASPQQQAFIGTASSITVIPPLAGWNSSVGYGINDSGQVAGYLDNSIYAQQAIVATSSGTTAVPLPAGWNWSEALAINNSGQVCGLGGFNSNSGAFIGTASGISAIPAPPGLGRTYCLAINDSGQVVGNGSSQAFFGTAAGIAAIPLPPGATTSNVSYQSLNNSGVVVGYSDAGAWIWDATNGTRLLNNYVPSGSNIMNALSISGNGLILVQGGSFNGVGFNYAELVPAVPATPAPATWMLVISGLGLLAYWRWVVRYRREGM